MRLIDADALKELFSEVIGHIAQKPEMNGNLEHMIRASAMVIQMIDDAPTVQPDTTTYDSIPVETGKNDGDGTSGDLISRTQAIDEIHEDAEWLASQGSDWQTERMERDKSILMSLPSVQPETNCSEIPNNSDTIYRQQAIDAVDSETASTNPEHFKSSEKFIKFMDDADIASFGKWQWANGFNTAVVAAKIQLKKLPSAQPERTCVNCGRTVNNGGWYADGRTRCPIEEHYALPKDGFCHLWEKRNVTDDDYPERMKE